MKRNKSKVVEEKERAKERKNDDIRS